MEQLGQYGMCLISGAMICGIAASFFPEGRGKTLICMLCGLCLTILALSPAAGFDWDVLSQRKLPYGEAGAQAAALGEKMAREAAGAIIKEQTQAYILDKAAALNASVTADVSVDRNNTPWEVTFSGEISPYAKSRLEAIVHSRLGIPKERQIWTG